MNASSLRTRAVTVFLVRGAEAVVALMAVLEAQEFLAVMFPAPGFAPQVGGLYGRHEDFLRARAVHFLADDIFYFFQYAPCQRADSCKHLRQLTDKPARSIS